MQLSASSRWVHCARDLEKPGPAVLAVVLCLCISLVALQTRDHSDAVVLVLQEEADDPGEPFWNGKQVNFGTIVPI